MEETWLIGKLLWLKLNFNLEKLNNYEYFKLCSEFEVKFPKSKTSANQAATPKEVKSNLWLDPLRLAQNRLQVRIRTAQVLRPLESIVASPAQFSWVYRALA